MATGNYSYWKNCLTMIRAGTGITVDNSDPMKPIINATGGGGGGGIESVVAGDNVTVDDTDPLNPIINAGGGLPFKTIMWTVYADGTDESDIHYTIHYNDTGRNLLVSSAGIELDGLFTNKFYLTIPVINNSGGSIYPIPLSESKIGLVFEEGTLSLNNLTGSVDSPLRLKIEIYE